MPKLAFASPAASFTDDDDTDLRFEESDDFSNYPAKPTPVAPRGDHSHDEDPYGSLKTKQEELLRLRHELEKKEREANELEARKQKEERFTNGRREMTERLARTLARLEREYCNAQKAIEEITVARSSFERHLNIIRAQQPESWQRSNLDAELDHALAAIDDSEDEYAKCMRRLNAVIPQDGTVPPAASAALATAAFPSDFKTCARMGLAFTLPLAIILALTILLVKFFMH